MDTARETVADWIHRLNQAARGQGFQVDSMGTAHGFPLPVWKKPAEGKPRVYLSAGFLGDEQAGPLAVECLLNGKSFDNRCAWTICPLLNPGGFVRNQRLNPDGIDLNRDYLANASPEISAHCRWLLRTPPHDLYLSLHEDWEASGFYLYEINSSGQPVSLCQDILRAVGEVVPIEANSCIDNHTVAAPGFIRHDPEPDEPDGWPEAIFHAKLYPHLSYTMETPSSLPMERRIAAHVTGVKTAVRLFPAKNFFDGMSRRPE